MVLQYRFRYIAQLCFGRRLAVELRLLWAHLPRSLLPPLRRQRNQLQIASLLIQQLRPRRLSNTSASSVILVPASSSSLSSLVSSSTTASASTKVASSWLRYSSLQRRPLPKNRRNAVQMVAMLWAELGWERNLCLWDGLYYPEPMVFSVFICDF